MFDHDVTSWKIFKNCMKEISLNPPILQNGLIRFKNYKCFENKPIFFSEWYNFRMMFLEDMFHNTSTFFKTLDEFY